MKVLNLRCANGHGFEGWFGSEDDFLSQNGRGLVECPLCADKIVTKLPSAPRLNLSAAAKEPASQAQSEPHVGNDSAPQAHAAEKPHIPPEVQAQWMGAVREMMRRTEDVGPRFAEEARRIHYGEAPERGIRGQATPAEREALQEEGIETFSMSLPKGLEGPLQ